MDKRTRGSWILHHAQKLDKVDGGQQFERILVAGKAGILLSALSASEESILTMPQVNTLAQAAGIKVSLELPTLISELRKNRLINQTNKEICVLGISNSALLDHTANIFDSTGASKLEEASIELSEMTSQTPRLQSEAAKLISDCFELHKIDLDYLFEASEKIGFVDGESLDATNRFLFNGNLFRREDAQKLNSIFRSLTSSDAQLVTDLEEELKLRGCVDVLRAKTVLGEKLFSKLVSIGMFDISTVSNDTEHMHYVTRPSAFSKFGNSAIEDSLDLAKSLVAALTYGMNRSSPTRGRIVVLPALLKRLIDGHQIGPADAIGEDYKVLELSRVVEIQKTPRGFFMRLLKKEVGELARRVLSSGDVGEAGIPGLCSASITQFRGPEPNRMIERKQSVPQSRKAMAELLEALRSGRRA